MMSHIFHLSLLFVGLCQAYHVPSSGSSTSQTTGSVPVAQVRMLSLGLAHLLHGVEEHAKWLEQQGEQVEAELDRVTESVEGLHKQSLQGGRTHRQVRKDLQIVRARGDRLWKTVKDLQKSLEDLEMEQEAMNQRMRQMIQRVKSVNEPRTEGRSQANFRSARAVMGKQARRLSSLSSLVSAQDRMINRRQQHIEHLEKKVSQNLPPALRNGSDSGCV